jgi:hypothetical protein
VIYELDTPIVTDTASTVALRADGSDPLASMFAVSDPAARAITEYQVYDTSSLGAAVADSFLVGGKDETASSAAQAITLSASALSSVDFLSGLTAASDVLDIRAFNGLYWGDWQTDAISVAAPSAPEVNALTANQTWKDGQKLSFTLASNTFTDPQQEALTYTASEANGAALPSWLNFYAMTASFSGTVPSNESGTLALDVTAKDTSGLTATEALNVTFASAGANPSATQTYGFGRGSGDEQIILGFGAHADLDFGSGVATNQLWLTQSGGNLRIDIMGTHDQVTIAGWYTNPASQLQEIATADGSMLDTQLQKLVGAMASYSAAHPSFNPTTATQAPSDPTLQAALAAAWHH